MTTHEKHLLFNQSINIYKNPLVFGFKFIKIVLFQYIPNV